MTDTIPFTREEVEGLLDALVPVSAYGRVGSRDVEQKALQAAAETLRARLARQQNEEECRKTCTSLCAGTGDTGGDWPCVKQRG